MIGKIIGGVLGFMTGGPVLMIVGLWLGHMFDKARRRMAEAASPEEMIKIQQTFFESVFLLMGHVAKSDGHISETEISLTQSLMEQMGLTAEHKREAIRLFKLGAESDFNLDDCLNHFRAVCGGRRNLSQMLLVYVINLAIADGGADEAEIAILRKIAQGVGYSSFAFEQILRMIRAQNQFNNEGAGRSDTPTADRLTAAYEALGVEKTVTDAELKKAWRKLMSEYHPDKLTGQGMPEDMVKAATVRSQEIQTAYDVIKKSRGLR